MLPLLASLTLPVQAEVVVLANTRNSIEHASRTEIVNFFMGRYRKTADNGTVRPFDLEADSPARKVFYRMLLNKSQEEVHAYWVRLVFSGQTAPPTQTKGQEEMLNVVANDPTAIGYVERSFLGRAEHGSAARNVKVIFSLPE